MFAPGSKEHHVEGNQMIKLTRGAAILPAAKDDINLALKYDLEQTPQILKNTRRKPFKPMRPSVNS